MLKMTTLNQFLRRLPPALALLVVLWAPTSGVAGEAQARVPARPDYPVPPPDAKRLFFLQRSSNSNTVVYDANLTRDGKLDPERPVEVYWLRYNTTGEKRALNFIERHLAYGVNSRPADDDEEAFLVSLVAFKERRLRVVLDGEGGVRATTTIAGRPAELRRLFIEVVDGLFPTVVHVDIFGEDVATGEVLYERFIP